MQVVYVRCAGLDVHKKTVSACVSVCEAGEAKWQKTRTFRTFTQDLLLLADWLKECDRGDNSLCFQASGTDYNAGLSAPGCDATSFRMQSVITLLLLAPIFILRCEP